MGINYLLGKIKYLPIKQIIITCDIINNLDIECTYNIILISYNEIPNYFKNIIVIICNSILKKY